MFRVGRCRLVGRYMGQRSLVSFKNAVIPTFLGVEETREEGQMGQVLTGVKPSKAYVDRPWIHSL